MSRTLRRAGMELAAPLVHLVFPDICRVCDLPRTDVSQLPMCAACAAATEVAQRGALCGRCGTALGWESLRFAEALGTQECMTCRMAPPAFARAVAFAEYDAAMREVLHLLKYEHERVVAGQLLGAHLASAVERLLPDAANELLVIPVPLHAARLAQRGFNQAEAIARAGVRALQRWHGGRGFDLRSNILERTKATPALFGLTPKQRRAAVEGAFRVVRPEAVRGREVLLVDDIMTTGATARVCARALRHAGAEKVWVATVARAQPEELGGLRNVRGPQADVSLWR